MAVNTVYNPYGDSLEHYGVKGMEWGKKKKSLTAFPIPAGKKSSNSQSLTKSGASAAAKQVENQINSAYSSYKQQNAGKVSGGGTTETGTKETPSKAAVKRKKVPPAKEKGAKEETVSKAVVMKKAVKLTKNIRSKSASVKVNTASKKTISKGKSVISSLFSKKKK